MLLWGIGYATQDTLFKALIASVLPEGKRNFAFGLFYAGYGLGWLVGSVATGLLYDRSRLALIVFSVAAQIISLPNFHPGSTSESPLRINIASLDSHADSQAVKWSMRGCLTG